MSSVYKTQGQNAQRLLAINETLREREESARADTESLRQARDEIAQLRRKVEQHSEQMAEKDRVIQVCTVSSPSVAISSDSLASQTLTDDVTMLNLEYTTMEEQKEELRKDNATLLQRWIDRMNSEVDKLNDANAFYDDMRTRWHATTQGDEASNGRLHTQASRESLASTGSLVSSPGNGSRSNQGTSPAKGGLGADPKLPKAGLLLNPNG
jgi:autophagy-related protein 16